MNVSPLVFYVGAVMTSEGATMSDSNSQIEAAMSW